MALQMMQGLSRTPRKPRRPQHQFHIRTRPWAIQPCFIAPVLPGETLRRLLVQVRAVSDPVKNPLVGWWYEMYFFYVKHRDLDERADLVQLVLDPTADLTTHYVAADLEYYHFADTMPWAKLCTKRVVEEYFRDEGEDWDGQKIGNMPACRINQTSWLDSAILASEWETVDVDIADSTLDDSADFTASGIHEALNQWYLQRHQGLTQMSYEEWLRSYGVKMPDEAEPHTPELVRYLRDWTYPSNTIDPTDGTPSSALSWSIAERADKHRYFPEPGFLVGYVVVRPKVYRSNQIGAAAGALVDAYKWLPSVLWDDVQHAYATYATTEGPVDNIGASWMFDVRDLFLYGDQFLNFDPAAAEVSEVALPSATLQRNYASGTDADGLFVSASPLNKIRCDGVVSLDIASSIKDLSPPSATGNL